LGAPSRRSGGRSVAAAAALSARRRRWLFAVGGLAAVTLVAVVGLNRLTATTAAEEVRLYEVTRRNVPIVLQEKGELEAANSIDIRCELEGRSTIIDLVPEGTHVKKGDLLVELASDVIDENIRNAEIKEAVALAAFESSQKEHQILLDKNASDIRKANLDLWLAQEADKKYKEGEAAELRQDAELALDKAKYVVERTTEQLKDSQELYEQGFITRIELQNDEFEKYQAGIELKKAQLAIKVLNTYTVPMAIQENESAVTEAEKELERTKKAAAASEAKSKADVEAKESELALTREKLTKLREQKAKARIIAPAAGLVVYSREHGWRGNSESRIELGAQVYERQSLIELPDVSAMKAVIRVHEAKTEMVKLGLPATIEVEGVSGRVFHGKVSKIAVLADSTNRWLNPNLKEYETEILIDGTHPELKPGVTARTQVFVTELKNVIAVPVQSVFGKGGRYYVFVDEGGQPRPAEVRVGQANSEYAEITSGLQVGQKVYLAITDQMKLTLPDVDREKGNNTRQRRRQPRTASPDGKPARAPATRPAG
jgi:HlyD family secretion protein